MTRHTQAQMLFHGTLVLLGGLLAGLPLAGAIIDGRGPETIHAWAVTHSSLIAAGILLLVVGAAGRHLSLPARGSALLAGTLLPSTYALSVGLVVTAVAGHRGLTASGPALNVLLYVGNVAGALGVLLAGALLVRGAYGAWRAETASAARHGAAVEAR